MYRDDVHQHTKPQYACYHKYIRIACSYHNIIITVNQEIKHEPFLLFMSPLFKEWLICKVGNNCVSEIRFLQHKSQNILQVLFGLVKTCIVLNYCRVQQMLDILPLFRLSSEIYFLQLFGFNLHLFSHILLWYQNTGLDVWITFYTSTKDKGQRSQSWLPCPGHNFQDERFEIQ